MSGSWNFYGRRDELGNLLEEMRQQRWFFGAIRGRRRIGKTALIQQALTTLAEDEPNGISVLLVQLPDSSPEDLASVFRSAVREAALGHHFIRLDSVRDLPGVAAAVGSLCSVGTVVVLDEFQTCHRGPLRGLPSLLQVQVDRLQGRSPVGGLIVLGSVQAEMEALINDRQAPLFGRTTFDLRLEPWDIQTIFEVCQNHGANDPARCLTLWTLFGGVPKYWRHFAETEGLDAIPEWESWVQEVCEKLFLRSDSPLREEGESLLGRELRRNYVAVLRTMAEREPCTHRELQQAIPGRSLGPYLKTLSQDLRLIEKQHPIFANERQRRARYVVSDPFLLAWLRVIQPACQAARIEPASSVARRISSRLRTLEGHAFERMVWEASEAASRAGNADFPMTDRVRGYWNRPQRDRVSVEIDFIAWNENDQRVRFGSCKRNPASHDSRSLHAFREHLDRFLSTTVGSRFRRWDRELVLFSPQFSEKQRVRLEAENYICRDLVDFQCMLGDRERGEKGALGASPKVTGEE